MPGNHAIFVVFDVVLTVISINAYTTVENRISSSLKKLFKNLPQKYCVYIARSLTIPIYSIFVLSLIWKAVTGFIADGLFPSPFKSNCEKEAVFLEYKSKGVSGLSAFIEKCERNQTFLFQRAVSERADEDYKRISVCIDDQKCDADKCLNGKNNLNLENIEALKRKAREVQIDAGCGNNEPFAPVLPPHLPKSPIDPKIAASDRRLAALEEASEAWRGRRKPVYADFGTVFDAITLYDKTRFADNPEAGSAWATLSLARQQIGMKKTGLNSTTKNSIPITVIKNGSGSMGDRASEALIGWLRDNGFQVSATNAALFVEISGTANTVRNYVYSQYDSTANFEVTIRWLDGQTYLSKAITSTRSAASEDDAESASFADALTKLFHIFGDRTRR